MWQPVPGGSGTYIVELVAALRAMGAPLVGITARHGSGADGAASGLGDLPLRGSRLPRQALYESWNRLEHPRAEAIVPGAELVHATTWAVPGTRLPLVVTVHDVAFLRSPEHFTRRGAAYFRRALERTRREARCVVVPSSATADDCIAAGIPAGAITVIPHGVTTRSVLEEDRARFRREHGLERPYILWTGTREPRKNLEGVLAAFGLIAERREDVDLVLVGPSGWGEDASEGAVRRRLGERVHVLGRLDDDDLAAAYSEAAAFVFPSHWEGFGLPVLEAMAYGAPVVTSRGTCMEEVCGETGLLVDPSSAEDIAHGLERALGPEGNALVGPALERAAGFTWRASAEAHLAVYKEAVR